MEHGRLKLFDLSGKVAVVTGGNGGIGLGMARGLASAGATVVIAARDLEKSQAAVEDLASRGTSVLTIPVDVTQEASVSGLFAATLERCGRLDVLVNKAGTNIRHPAHELSLAQWHTVIDTNLTSAFMCAKAAYPTLKHGGGGKIINYRLDDVDLRRPVCACLRGQQRRHRPTDALARQRLGS
jgi:2-dehydro-3-deoxy-D-gluconate 5-dehydrogenase